MEQWEKSIVASWPRSELEKENAGVAYRAAIGGIVLLENRGALPLTKGKIALYGIGARVYEKGGTGSGDVYTREPLSLKEALESEGYEITNASYLDRLSSSISEAEEKRDEEIIKRGKKYSAFDVSGLMGLLSLPAAAPEEPFLKEDDLPSERGTALYFIRRQAGEGRDREEVPGDYLLSEVEKKNLLFLKSSFEKLIVVINSGSPVDPSFLKGLEAGALVYLGQAGSQGPKALTALISGRESFSGHLAVSWPLSLADLPSTARFSSRGSREKEEYIEGIYVGYRFHDSFGVPAAYPFGYGLSYASFKASYSYSLKGDEVKVAASVENVSSLKGRPLIQVYLSCPSVSLPREYQGLAAYKKGKELAPGEKERLEMSFSLRDFAAYDEETSSYLLEEGEYLIRAGFSSVDTELIGSIRLSKRVLVERSFPLVKGKRVHEIAPLGKKKAETAPSYVGLDPSSIVPLFHERKAEIPDAEAQGYLAKLTHKEKLSLLAEQLHGSKGRKPVPHRDAAVLSHLSREPGCRRLLLTGVYGVQSKKAQRRGRLILAVPQLCPQVPAFLSVCSPWLQFFRKLEYQLAVRQKLKGLIPQNLKRPPGPSVPEAPGYVRERKRRSSGRISGRPCPLAGPDRQRQPLSHRQRP